MAATLTLQAPRPWFGVRERHDRVSTGASESSRHAELLAAVDLFHGLDRLALAKLAALLDPVHLNAGALACAQGEPADSLYLVSRGTLGVYVASSTGDRQTRVAALREGACFGEMALLTSASRTATVRAESDVELLRFEGTRFLDVLRREPTIGLAIGARLSRRLDESNHDRAAAEQAVRHLLRHRLARLAPETRRRVLKASVLHCPSPRSLVAVFGREAGAVAAGLADVGVPVGTTGEQPIPTSIATALRGLLADELGSDGLLAHHRSMARVLAETGCWEDALQVLAHAGARSDFTATFARALGASTAISDEAASRWAGHLTDDEAAQDPALALLRATWHEQRMARDAALAVLVQAQETHGGDPAAARLAAGIARLAGGDLAVTPAQSAAGPSWQHRAAHRFRAQQRPKTMAAVAIAFVLGVAAEWLRGSPPQAFALLLGAAVCLWVSAAVPEFVVYLGLVVLWIVLGIAKPEQALAGFGTTSWMSAVAILAIASAISSSGLLFRFGLWLVRRLPAGLFAQGVTFLLTGMMMTPLLPSSTARAGLVLPLALTAAQAQRLRERGPESAFLGLAAFVGANPLLFMFLNGSTSCLLALGLLPEASRARFDFVRWFVAAAPLAVVVSLGSVALLWLLLRPVAAERVSTTRVDVQSSLLGPLSGREMRMAGILVATIIGWNVGPAVGLSSAVVGLLGIIAAALVGCFDKRALLGLSWDFLLGYGVILAISRLTVSLGIGDAIAAAIQQQPVGTALVPPLFLLAVVALNLALRLVLPADQALLLLALSLAPAAQAMGIDPWIVVITLLATGSVWFFPTQNYGYLVADEAAERRLFAPAHARAACLCYTAAALAGLAVSLPYWRLLGLL